MPKEDSSGTDKSRQSTQSFLQRFIDYIGRHEIRQKVQDEIIDPLLNHVMKRVFPYIILTCVLFILLLLAVLITLGIIIFQNRSPGVSVVQPPFLAT